MSPSPRSLTSVPDLSMEVSFSGDHLSTTDVYGLVASPDEDCVHATPSTLGLGPVAEEPGPPSATNKTVSFTVQVPPGDYSVCLAPRGMNFARVGAPGNQVLTVASLDGLVVPDTVPMTVDMAVGLTILGQNLHQSDVVIILPSSASCIEPADRLRFSIVPTVMSSQWDWLEIRVLPSAQNAIPTVAKVCVQFRGDGVFEEVGLNSLSSGTATLSPPSLLFFLSTNPQRIDFTADLPRLQVSHHLFLAFMKPTCF